MQHVILEVSSDLKIKTLAAGEVLPINIEPVCVSFEILWAPHLENRKNVQKPQGESDLFFLVTLAIIPAFSALMTRRGIQKLRILAALLHRGRCFWITREVPLHRQIAKFLISVHLENVIGSVEE